MDSWGPYGSPAMSPAPPATPTTGTTGIVKAAVGLTMLAIAFAVVEAILAVYMLQQMATNEAVNQSPDDLENFKISFGIMIGVNLVISAGLAGGAILALRRSVAGKVLIWISGLLSMLMRCTCGGFAGIFVYLYNFTSEENDSPLSVGMWTLLLAIEVLALLTILVAMIMLMTKGASFKDPNARPPGGYGGGPPAGYGGYGSPAGPPSGPPAHGGPPPGSADGLPNLPPTPGWPT